MASTQIVSHSNFFVNIRFSICPVRLQILGAWVHPLANFVVFGHFEAMDDQDGWWTTAISMLVPSRLLVPRRAGQNFEIDLFYLNQSTPKSKLCKPFWWWPEIGLSPIFKRSSASIQEPLAWRFWKNGTDALHIFSHVLFFSPTLVRVLYMIGGG